MTTCGPTHYAGCACHEAAHAAEIADLKAAHEAELAAKTCHPAGCRDEAIWRAELAARGNEIDGLKMAIKTWRDLAEQRFAELAAREERIKELEAHLSYEEDFQQRAEKAEAELAALRAR